MTILLHTQDLLCGSRVASAARALGLDLRQVADREECARAAAVDEVELVLLDLAAPGLATAELVPRLRACRTRSLAIIAFGPHVDEARLSVAREAGCDRVLARGQFLAQLPAILTNAPADSHSGNA